MSKSKRGADWLEYLRAADSLAEAEEEAENGKASGPVLTAGCVKSKARKQQRKHGDEPQERGG